MQGTRTAFPKPNMGARKVLEEMLPNTATAMQNGVVAGAGKDLKEGVEEQQLPEIWAYLGVLVQVYLPSSITVHLGGILTNKGLSL